MKTAKQNAPSAPPRPRDVGSTSPLWKKLGLKPGMRVAPLEAPAEWERWLGAEAPAFVRTAGLDGTTDLVHAFVSDRATLRALLMEARRALSPTATLWVSWPKRTSGVPTDVTEDVIRADALPLGWVDVKVCAVSPVWSGLKLVVRVSER